MQRNSPAVQAESTPEDNVPKLDKDIWLHLILPIMDIKSLLALSATSKEERYYAFNELNQRPRFANNIIKTLYSAESMMDYDCGRLRESRWDTWVGGNSLAKIVRAGSAWSAFMTLIVLKEYITMDAATMESRGLSNGLVTTLVGADFVATLALDFFFKRVNYIYTNNNNFARDHFITDYNNQKTKIETLTQLTNPNKKANFYSPNLFAKPRCPVHVDEPEESQTCVMM